jgi:putative ABC transport system ATP-binding protein
MIEVHDLSRRFFKEGNEVSAVDEVSFSLDPGEFVTLRGPSGSGKTTLLTVLGGLLRPSSGHVVIDGNYLWSLSKRARARFRARRVGFVFQLFHLISYLSVVDNVLLARRVTGLRKRRQRADELIERIGLSHRRGHQPAELSAGERQRVAIARALLNRPSLLLADEPTGNLDPDSARIVMELISDFHREGGTVLLATHDPIPAEYSERELHLSKGCLEAPIRG